MSRRGIADFMPPDPRHLPGYTGFVPNVQASCGDTYGNITHASLVQRRSGSAQGSSSALLHSHSTMSIASPVPAAPIPAGREGGREEAGATEGGTGTAERVGAGAGAGAGAGGRSSNNSGRGKSGHGNRASISSVDALASTDGQYGGSRAASRPNTPGQGASAVVGTTVPGYNGHIPYERAQFGATFGNNAHRASSLHHRQQEQRRARKEDFILAKSLQQPLDAAPDTKDRLHASLHLRNTVSVPQYTDRVFSRTLGLAPHAGVFVPQRRYRDVGLTYGVVSRQSASLLAATEALYRSSHASLASTSDMGDVGGSLNGDAPDVEVEAAAAAVAAAAAGVSSSDSPAKNGPSGAGFNEHEGQDGNSGADVAAAASDVAAAASSSGDALFIYTMNQGRASSAETHGHGYAAGNRASRQDGTDGAAAKVSDGLEVVDMDDQGDCGAIETAGAGRPSAAHASAGVGVGVADAAGKKASSSSSAAVRPSSASAAATAPVLLPQRQQQQQQQQQFQQQQNRQYHSALLQQSLQFYSQANGGAHHSPLHPHLQQHSQHQPAPQRHAPPSQPPPQRFITSTIVPTPPQLCSSLNSAVPAKTMTLMGDHTTSVTRPVFGDAGRRQWIV